MKKLIEKIKEELKKEEEHKEKLDSRNEQRLLITGKIEALRDCLHWAELTHLKNTNREHDQYKEGWLDGMNYAYTETIGKISESINDMKIVVKDL